MHLGMDLLSFEYHLQWPYMIYIFETQMLNFYIHLINLQLDYHHILVYRIAGIYYESFNFANFANFKAFAKI